MDSWANSNHFVKILLSNDVDSHTKLMIPRKFVMKYGDNLHTRMNLKTPNGLVWAVDLQRHKDDVWLHNGWFEFAKFYSLQFGHMLVFEYSGDSNFHVLIFDSSSTEIDYPLMTSNANLSFGKTTQVRKNVDKMDADSSTSSDSMRPFKKNKSQQKNSKGSATKEAKIRAQAFQSSNPFFVVHMKPTHVRGTGGCMVVKKTFKESYKMWKHNDQVTLQVEEKTWLVNCDMKWDWCRLSIGWDRFARDNSLNADDVCVFELVDASKKLLKAFIFRASEETNCEGNKRIPMVKCETEVARVLESVDAFQSKNPFFKVTIHSSYVHNGTINVPRSFIKRYITEKQPCDVILKVSQGRTWLVNCRVYKINARLSVGWKTFVQENTLAAGDVCIFELVNSAQKLLNVFMFRTES